MEPPRVLAIDDVRLVAPAEQADAVAAFYTDVLGLDSLKPLPEEQGLAFRGLARAGPRVIVRFDKPREDRAVRRQLALEVRSLQSAPSCSSIDGSSTNGPAAGSTSSAV